LARLTAGSCAVTYASSRGLLLPCGWVIIDKQGGGRVGLFW
jgi:hypothetical protein